MSFKPKSWFEGYRPINEPHIGHSLKRFCYNGSIERMHEEFDGYRIRCMTVGFELQSEKDVDDAILQLKVLKRGMER